MLFNDDNTLEDIMGCYLVASCWREAEFDTQIQSKLAEFVERIQDKLTRNRNKTRQTGSPLLWSTRSKHSSITAMVSSSAADSLCGSHGSTLSQATRPADGIRHSLLVQTGRLDLFAVLTKCSAKESHTSSILSKSWRPRLEAGSESTCALLFAASLSC